MEPEVKAVILWGKKKKTSKSLLLDDIIDDHGNII
jgi:hypothetical protein